MDNIVREIAPLTHPDNPVERLALLAGEDLPAVDRVIHSRMLSEAALIPDLARHLVDSGGKRLRPLITLASARQFHCSGDAHVKLAAAVEFIHTATLLHDDVVDESDLRRVVAAMNNGASAPCPAMPRSTSSVVGSAQCRSSIASTTG